MNDTIKAEDTSVYEECSICYESFTNKSFINECLHPFCYKCIIDWTKVKAVCPLCIRPITRILYNIRSPDDYDIQTVEPPTVDVLANIDSGFDFWRDESDSESNYDGMELMDVMSDVDSSPLYGDFTFAFNAEDNFSDYLTDNDECPEDDMLNESSESEEEKYEYSCSYSDCSDCEVVEAPPVMDNDVVEDDNESVDHFEGTTDNESVNYFEDISDNESVNYIEDTSDIFHLDYDNEVENDFEASNVSNGSYEVQYDSDYDHDYEDEYYGYLSDRY